MPGPVTAQCQPDCDVCCSIDIEPFVPELRRDISLADASSGEEEAPEPVQQDEETQQLVILDANAFVSLLTTCSLTKKRTRVWPFVACEGGKHFCGRGQPLISRKL